MVEKSKIYLVLTPFFPSKESFVGSYILDQLKQIRIQSNFNIQIVKVVSLFSNEKDYYFDNFSVKIFKLIDFPFFIFPGLFNYINKQRFSFFLEKNKMSGVHFSHSHVPYPSAYLVEDLGCKKIIQHHGLDVLQLMNGRSKFFRNIYSKFLIRNTIKHLNKADLNIGVSNLVLKRLRDYKSYNPKQEFVLYNGVDTSKFFKKDIEKNKFFTIGCVANFWKIKDQMTLIKSVQKILGKRDDLRLRFVGSGPTLQFCKEYVNQNNLSSFISFEREQVHEKLNDFYNEIDLFVLPSYYEALGCVYLESWATQTPFIGVEGQGISEIVPDKKKMLSAQHDVRELVNKILFFMHNEFQLKSVKHFDIKKTICDFLSLDIFSYYD